MRLKFSFVAYLVLLVWIVLWKLEPSHLGHPGFGNMKLLPFVSTDAFGGSGSAEVLVNLLLFLPLGAFPGVLTRGRSAPALLTLTALTSLALEPRASLVCVDPVSASFERLEEGRERGLDRAS